MVYCDDKQWRATISSWCRPSLSQLYMECMCVFKSRYANTDTVVIIQEGLRYVKSQLYICCITREIAKYFGLDERSS